MWNLNILLFVFYICCVHAKTDEEIKEDFIKKHLMKCVKDHPVGVTELMQLQQLVIPKTTESKCLLACAYRSEGTIDSKGMYNMEHGYKQAEEHKNGDEKRLANGRKLVETCVKVNDVQVSDGEKGCERAGLIFKCTVENAPKLGFKLN